LQRISLDILKSGLSSSSHDHIKAVEDEDEREHENHRWTILSARAPQETAQVSTNQHSTRPRLACVEPPEMLMAGDSTRLRLGCIEPAEMLMADLSRVSKLELSQFIGRLSSFFELV